MTTTTERMGATLRISPRVTLAKGDRFRAVGGPYWRTADGRRIPLGAKGPFVFLGTFERRGRTYIDALDRDHGHCVLWLGRSPLPSTIDDAAIMRPYKIRCRVV